MKRLRVLVVMHEDLVPPLRPSGEHSRAAEWKTERDVLTALGELGHDARPLGVRRDIRVVGAAIEEFKPDIVFNLLEEFDGCAAYDHNVVSYLELLGVPYTGCRPRGLMLARDKSLAKKVLAFHHVPVPAFAVCPIGQAVRKPQTLHFPLIVKSVSEEASLGISQASIVTDERKLRERVGFIHASVGTDALIEQYIDGREFYVGILGHREVTVLPIWELDFHNMPEDACRIATERVKWSLKYQRKYGITSREAADLSEFQAARIRALAKQVYEILELTGYARIDFRMDQGGQAYVLEANPNPQIARDEDFADSAKRAGISYSDLIQRALEIGLQWRKAQAA
jgi:D-alanine-D-alanine ligase